MSKSIPLTHAGLSQALETSSLTIRLESIVDLRRKGPATSLVRIDDAAVELFATREGRGREVALYLLENAAKELHSAVNTEGPVSLVMPLGARELDDQTLADSFRLLADRCGIVPEAVSFLVPLKDYLAQLASALPALTRLRLAGFGLVMAIDNVKSPPFRTIVELPMTGLAIRGADTWRRLRTIGPGKLGDLGSWIGWAEANGLKRLALDIADASAEQTARLYGFSLAHGTHYVAAAELPILKRASN